MNAQNLTRTRTRQAAGTAVAVLAGLAALTLPATAAQATGNTSSSCYARNGALYCGNNAPATVYREPGFTAGVDTLRSSHSYFQCWVYGAKHRGGNTVWYFTYGDDTNRWGYVPASEIHTSQDPFPGVTHC
ncbi:hypothetical protein [Longispora albida]|uniref:hypothetical protein n=1 Tax=Longispora albida TaxID=203523 RepID=UPI00036F985F|nr:hypothetical protein [Longispora albida]